MHRVLDTLRTNVTFEKLLTIDSSLSLEDGYGKGEERRNDRYLLVVLGRQVDGVETDPAEGSVWSPVASHCCVESKDSVDDTERTLSLEGRCGRSHTVDSKADEAACSPNENCKDSARRAKGGNDEEETDDGPHSVVDTHSLVEGGVSQASLRVLVELQQAEGRKIDTGVSKAETAVCNEDGSGESVSDEHLEPADQSLGDAGEEHWGK